MEAVALGEHQSHRHRFDVGRREQSMEGRRSATVSHTGR